MLSEKERKLKRLEEEKEFVMLRITQEATKQKHFELTELQRQLHLLSLQIPTPKSVDECGTQTAKYSIQEQITHLSNHQSHRIPLLDTISQTEPLLNFLQAHTASLTHSSSQTLHPVPAFDASSQTQSQIFFSAAAQTTTESSPTTLKSSFSRSILHLSVPDTNVSTISTQTDQSHHKIKQQVMRAYEEALCSLHLRFDTFKLKLKQKYQVPSPPSPLMHSFTSHVQISLQSKDEKHQSELDRVKNRYLETLKQMRDDVVKSKQKQIQKMKHLMGPQAV